MNSSVRPLDSLSPQQRAVLLRKLQERRAAANSSLIRRREVQNFCPLSFGQELMWLLDQLTPGVSVYNVPRVLRIQGALNADALRRALNEVVNRHEVLRSTYKSVEGSPVQVIAPTANLELEAIDLRALAPDDREQQVVRLAIEHS